MQLVRRFAATAVLAAIACTGCTHAQSQSAPAARVRVAAAIEVSPVPLAVPAHVRPVHVAAAKKVTHQAAKAAVRQPVAARAALTPTAVKPAVAKTTAPKPTAPKPVASKPAAPRTAAPQPTGDAYPYKTSTSQANDAWGFTQRQCVSYAAWRLSQAGHAISNASGNWGSALTWDDAARRLGYAVTSTPSVGSVAQWNAGESGALYASSSATSPSGTFSAGSYGHVAWVTHVYSDGSVQVSHYNATGDRSFSSMHLKAPRYLHIG